MRWFYDLLYRHLKAPWDTGPRAELVALVEEGRLRPGRAIDLGSGTASNCIYLAQHGFDVTGVDFAPGAIELGSKRAKQAGVQVEWVVDDLTDLKRVRGPFDVLVDYGTLDDLSPAARDKYVENVLPLTRPGTQFLLWCFEWKTRWWENLMPKYYMEPGEVEQRFAPHFDIERIAGEQFRRGFPPGYAAYLMVRTEDKAGG